MAQSGETGGAHEENDDSIKWGDSIVIKLYDEKSSVILRLHKDTQKIGRTAVSVGPMIGKPYGSVFEIVGHKIMQVDDENVLDSLLDTDNNPYPSNSDTKNDNDNGNGDEVDDEDIGERPSKMMRGDNRTFVDTNTAQKLTATDIQKIRQEGGTGLDILRSLVANSETWGSKNEFAQAKYLKRKSKKYLKRFRVIKCCPRTVCEVYTAKNPDKILHIRWDVLAQVISQSGVHAGSKVLIFESMIGLLAGTIAYRMRGCGSILSVYATKEPTLNLIGDFNLNDDSLSVVQSVCSEEIGHAVDDVKVTGFVHFVPAPDSPPGEAIVSPPGGAERAEKAPQKLYWSTGRRHGDLKFVRGALRNGVDRYE